jgi:hypothetical protein
MVLIEASGGGRTGLGYTYGDAATGVLVRDTLAPLVEGCDALAVRATTERPRRACRNLGRPGIAAMAVSAVDNALWDLKARLLDVPTCDPPSRTSCERRGRGTLRLCKRRLRQARGARPRRLRPTRAPIGGVRRHAAPAARKSSASVRSRAAAGVRSVVRLAVVIVLARIRIWNVQLVGG